MMVMILTSSVDHDFKSSSDNRSDDEHDNENGSSLDDGDDDSGITGGDQWCG